MTYTAPALAALSFGVLMVLVASPDSPRAPTTMVKPLMATLRPKSSFASAFAALRGLLSPSGAAAHDDVRRACTNGVVVRCAHCARRVPGFLRRANDDDVVAHGNAQTKA